MECVRLNNGVEMPMMGLGTFQIPKEKMIEVIRWAYDLGYRKFDTAWKYNNETDIAVALKKNGIKREDVFLTTKINADSLYWGGVRTGKHSIFNVRNFTSIESAIQKSMNNLKTEYIDLFLIHWPWPIPIAQKIYRKLTEFYNEGRIRAIGVCSSLPPHIDAFADVSDVVPAVNQFEISPLNTQKDLIQYCQKLGIQVEAMSTFSHFRATETRKEIVDNEVIAPIAKRHNKSIPQIVLRWLIQQGISVIPKSSNQSRLTENINIFDFSLSEEEMFLIDSLDKGNFLNYNPYVTLGKACSMWGNVPAKYRNWNGFDNL